MMGNNTSSNRLTSLDIILSIWPTVVFPKADLLNLIDCKANKASDGLLSKLLTDLVEHESTTSHSHPKTRFHQVSEIKVIGGDAYGRTQDNPRSRPCRVIVTYVLLLLKVTNNIAQEYRLGHSYYHFLKAYD